MLRRYRSERRELTREFAGQHWSEDGTAAQVPVNLLALYVSVVGRNLIAQQPRVLLSTFNRALKPTVSALQSWGNRELKRMHLQETLQRVVTDGLFSLGICKVALATPAEAAAFAWNLGAGQPFAERVDLDDFVYDIHARAFEEVSYIGHRYRVPLDTVRDSPLYSKARKELSASSDEPYNLEGDEKITTLGRGVYAGNQDEFEDHVSLWEIYLPQHRLILTLADDYLSGAAPGVDREPLRTQTWLGPASGPYHLLGYGIVPGNAMPKAPLQDLVDLHRACNRAYRKLIRMSDRIKALLGVAGGAMEDGTRVMQADDGDIIRLDRPEAVKPLVSGVEALGPVQAVAMELKNLFVYLAGNLDMMGGLSPQSKTATQDEMLEKNASRAIADMQQRTVNFAAEVIESLCWYWWHDPFAVQKVEHTLPGLPGMPLLRQVSPQQRQQGRFEDLDIGVDPYSLQHTTPQARMSALNQVVTQIVLPMMTLMVQQGVSFDINAYLQKISQYMDMPDLAEIVTIAEPPAQDVQGGAPDRPSMPAQTSRTYTRQNMPGATREASDRNTITSLMGVNTGGNPQRNGQPAGMGG